MKVTALYFSPCGSSEKCAKIVAEELAKKFDASLNFDSFTTPAERENVREYGADDILVIASPTFAGKLPNKILPDFKEKIKANGAKAVALVTFGNRSYDNSLAELYAVLKENNFVIPAAAALVNEHSFAHIGIGRPNANDIAEIKTFAQNINLDSCASVPGDADAPYYVPKQENGEPAKFLKATPKTDLDKCVKCGVCAKSCPMGSINPDNTAEVTGVCIKCHACVNKCQKQAKYFDDEQLISHAAMLKANYTDEKKNEFF